jgi:hypothetical protein
MAALEIRVSPKSYIQAEVGMQCFMGTFSADACRFEVRMTRIFSDVFRSWYAGCRIWVRPAQLNGWEVLGGKGYGAGNISAGMGICRLNLVKTVLCHIGMMSATSIHIGLYMCINYPACHCSLQFADCMFVVSTTLHPSGSLNKSSTIVSH